MLPGRYKKLIEALISVFKICGIDILKFAKNDLNGNSGKRVMTSKKPINA